ncbi:MAG: phosphoglucosamine mutase [Pseudomonadota bacterium]|jgi:phosphoglucosamine mutase
MTQRKYFGTDGIRGKVGNYPITPDFVLKLGWAAGKVLGNEGLNRILIGKDTRISGYMFESALEAGLSAAGMNIRLLGPMPTPAIAYLTRTFHARAGIVVSASHNLFEDNGIKFFSSDGKKLPDSIEENIENMLEQPMTTVSSAQLGKAERIDDAAGRYIEFCKSTFPLQLHLNGLKIVVDCAHGATYHIAPNVLTELGAKVVSIGVKPNGLNINEKCGATYTKTLQATVLEQNADIGIALDGDGDRLMMVDHRGKLLDGDDILYILAAARRNENLGTIVGTQMSNFALEQAITKMGLNFVRAAVGDRYVMEALQQHNSVLGGEASGHIICLDKTTTGDGIITALQVLAVMLQTGLSLSELGNDLNKYPQTLKNIRLNAEENPREILNSEIVKTAIASAEKQLANKGRVLLRPSGTEPLLRIMVEAQEESIVENLINELTDAVHRSIQH